MGVPATVWDVAGTGFGTWACGSGLDVSLGLTFHPHQLFQHLVGGADDLRGSRVGPLHHDHVGEFLTDIDCRGLKRALDSLSCWSVVGDTQGVIADRSKL